MNRDALLLSCVFAALWTAPARAVDLRPGDLLITHGDVDFDQQLTLTRVDPKTGQTETVVTFEGFPTEELEGLAVDGRANIFVLTGDRSAVTRVDAKTGAIDVLSSSDLNVGIGPRISEEPADIGVLSDGHLAVLDLDDGRILHVDRTTGLRSVLSDGSGGPLGNEGPVGLGPDFDDPWALAIGQSSLFVADQSGAVFQVDAATGDRAIIADDLTGTGPTLFGIDALAVTPDGSLLAADEDVAFSLLRIDRGTGNRKILSNSLIGSGPLPGAVKDIAVRETGDIYVIDTENLFRIDPLEGTRTLISLPLGPPRRHLTNLAVVHQVPEPSTAMLLIPLTLVATFFRFGCARKRNA